MTSEWTRPRKLEALDDVSTFRCGDEELDLWFHDHAQANQRAGMSNTFITSLSEYVAGFYVLATGGLSHADAPDRAKKGVARHALPVILLTRMGVDVSLQGQGLGSALLIDACRRVAQVSEEIGVRALLIHAKSDQVKAFYMSFAEFEPSPTDPLHLILLMKDLRKAIK